MVSCQCLQERGVPGRLLACHPLWLTSFSGEVTSLKSPHLADALTKTFYLADSAGFSTSFILYNFIYLDNTH
jgi:hypothetical protein